MGFGVASRGPSQEALSSGFLLHASVGIGKRDMKIVLRVRMRVILGTTRGIISQHLQLSMGGVYSGLLAFRAHIT